MPFNDVCENEKLKEGKDSNVNNSTLSLHIVAYENLIEASSNEFVEEESLGLIKNCENTKQIFTGVLSAIQVISKII
uniref:Uncharacterized protein n=1 Tax=Panagrolaimus sp. ES5 TaxID=591445 RepID=A0AC34GB94_9BILA